MLIGLIALALVLAALGLLLWRLRVLALRYHSFECARNSPKGWISGVAVFGADSVEWFRTLSLRPRAHATWMREAITVLERSYRAGGRAGDPDAIVEVTCTIDGTRIELAMRAGSYAGLASWLESAPPRERMV